MSRLNTAARAYGSEVDDGDVWLRPEELFQNGELMHDSTVEIGITENDYDHSGQTPKSALELPP